eukprot:CAMPEP_0194305620 /NCGR_PEP_ID=MMETSP0171-20130528/3017_1 /TAXON_ID=218684 /ORGANISM="Corethron pennatum, Strain L29A3" /LENGTH=68 /DNA_ID=CAMNT_0039057199 /DNA_START=61 /DNA_END=267 /DNA_ORIENTATION=+
MSARQVSSRSSSPPGGSRYPTCSTEGTTLLYGNLPRNARREREPQVLVSSTGTARPRVNEDLGGVETE